MRRAHGEQMDLAFALERLVLSGQAVKLPFRGQVLYMTPQQGRDRTDAIRRVLSLSRLL